jgi:hypothetical protein
MDNEGQSAGDKTGAQQVTPLKTAEDSPATQPATEQQLRATEQKIEEQIEERMTGFERSMVRLTRYGLAVTILTGIIFAGQLYEMITGSTATDRLVSYAKIQANAGSDIADAAQQFSDTADETNGRIADAVDQLQAAADNTKTTIRNTQTAFRAEQRAWVGVLGVADIAGFTETEVWKVKIVFFNSGRTPARKVQTSGMYVTSPTPLSGPSTENIKQLTFRPAQSIAPQGSYRESIGIEYPAEASTAMQREGHKTLLSEYSLIKTKQLFLYYFGILKYDDGFGKERETQFCVSLGNPDTKEAAFCDGFNDLD